MFALLRGIVGLAILAVLAYGVVAVPLGDKTLWQHIKAIAGSEEGKQLVDGVKHKADEVLKSPPASQPSPAEDLTPEERRELKRLIRERLTKKKATRE